jgi:tellurium resistance protein TerD
MINLQKGQSINLSKEVNAQGLQNLRASIGWDPNKFNTGGKFDLDISCFALADLGGGSYKLQKGSDFCFYNAPISANGALKYSGDNTTGGGEGDDEYIDIDLSKAEAGITNFSIVVSIPEPLNRTLNFGMVSNSYVRITNTLTGEEIARYDLGEDFSTETAVQFGSIYLYNNEWKFKAIGQGFQAGLSEFLEEYKYDNN